jgi:hypothetical protein
MNGRVWKANILQRKQRLEILYNDDNHVIVQTWKCERVLEVGSLCFEKYVLFKIVILKEALFYNICGFSIVWKKTKLPEIMTFICILITMDVRSICPPYTFHFKNRKRFPGMFCYALKTHICIHPLQRPKLAFLGPSRHPRNQNR